MLSSRGTRAAALVASCLVAGSAAAVLGSASSDNRWVLGILGVSSATLCIAAARHRYRLAGVADPLFLFIVGFAMYNSLIPIQVALRDPQNPLILANVYGATFSTGVYERAAELGVLSALVIAAVAFLFRSGSRRERDDGHEASSLGARLTPEGFFASGVCVYSFGLALMAIELIRTGGLVAVLVGDRSQRFALGATSHGSIPYVPFAVTGIALLWTAHVARGDRSLFKWALAALGLWTTLNVVLGDRRWIFYALLIVVASGEAKRLFTYKLTVRTIASILALYALAAGFAQVRYLVSPVLSGRTSLSTAYRQGRTEASSRWLLPSNNEFAAPFFTLLYAISEPQPYQHGLTYARALRDAVPRSLYPGAKTRALSDELANQVHDRYTPFDKTVNGFGVSPLAEGYLNFGAAGAVAEAGLAALFFGWASHLRWRGVRWQFLTVVLLPQAFVFNRLGFNLGESVWFVVAALLGLQLAGLLQGLEGGDQRRLSRRATRQKPPNASAPSMR